MGMNVGVIPTSHDLLLLLEHPQLPPRLSLLLRLPLPTETTSTCARVRDVSLVPQPCLQDAPDHVKSPSLDNSTSYPLASPDANVDDALECETEPISCVMVEVPRECFAMIWVMDAPTGARP